MTPKSNPSSEGTIGDSISDVAGTALAFFIAARFAAFACAIWSRSAAEDLRLVGVPGSAESVVLDVAAESREGTLPSQDDLEDFAELNGVWLPASASNSDLVRAGNDGFRYKPVSEARFFNGLAEIV
jgi:hypothetical protein